MTTRAEVLELIHSHCAVEESDLTENSLFEELSIDSLSFIELIVDIEDMCGVCLDGDELNIYGYKQVRDFVDTVLTRIESDKK